jgi:hypothetical protein
MSKKKSKNVSVPRSALIAVLEYVRDAAELLGRHEDVILEAMDLSGEAWQEVLGSVKKAVE